MNEKNIYKVYGHLNVTNGKWYVGMTSLNLEKRWNNGKGYQSQPKMWNDIRNSDWNADWIHQYIQWSFLQAFRRVKEKNI